MAGRKRVPGEEVRDEKMTLRWTKTELDQLVAAQQRDGVTYLADVPRVLALRALRLDDALAGTLAEDAELLEKAREIFDAETTEDLIALLVLRQLELMRSSLLELTHSAP